METKKRMLKPRHEHFCQLVVKELIHPLEAYAKAFNRPLETGEDRENCGVYSRRLLTKPYIEERIKELQLVIYGDRKAVIEALFPKAIVRIGSLIDNAKSEKVQLQASNAIVDRTDPIVKKSISERYVLKLGPGELAKLRNIYRTEVIDVTPGNPGNKQLKENTYSPINSTNAPIT